MIRLKYTSCVCVCSILLLFSSIVQNEAQHIIPYQAALLVFYEQKLQLCGGSLISPKFVLTAAHCTHRASRIQVVLGAYRYKQLEETQVVITSRKWFEHPLWNVDEDSNDLSLILLPYKIQLNQNIKTIKLSKFYNKLFERETVYSGWSHNSKTFGEDLITVNVTIVPNSICKKIYKKPIEQQICTIGDNNHGCYGFSGSPLVVDGYQVGVLSYGSEKCDVNLPLVHVDITYYHQWINSLIKM